MDNSKFDAHANIDVGPWQVKMSAARVKAFPKKRAHMCIIHPLWQQALINAEGPMNGNAFR